MANRGLLHHPLHARPSTLVAGSRFSFLRSSLFSTHRVDAFRCSFLSTPTSISVKSVKMEDLEAETAQDADFPQATLESSGTEAVEYVNKESPGPMVEVDPMTVFRRIIAERHTHFALEKQQADMQPFGIGSRWSGKATVAIALGTVLLLLLAAVLYFLRSRSGSSKQGELSSTDEKDGINGSAEIGRNKLVDDSIEAPESIRTAMAIGAASVGKPKGHTSPSLDATNGTLGLSVDQNAGFDVTEGQDANDAESLGSGSESYTSQASVSNEMLADKLVSEMSKGYVIYENPPSINLVNEEFFGEVPSANVVSEETSIGDDGFRAPDSLFDEREQDAVLEDSSAMLEKLEQVIVQESVPFSASQLDKVASVDASDGEADGRIERASFYDGGVTSFEPSAAGSTIREQQMATSNLMAHQDSGLLAYALTADGPLDSFNVDSREQNKKALEAALPALAIGVGTVGTLLGVGGGLKVVGFAALASFVSQDFFWAQSREELCQELKGITNRQKLLDFLARRNILSLDEEASL